MLAIGEEYANRMLALTGNPLARKIVHQIVWGYPSHEFCIDFDEAKRIALPVEPLPEKQDVALVNILSLLTKDDNYHGFARINAKDKTEPEVPKKSAVPNSKSSRRANGREEHGEAERV
jgi:hypothetical protein